MTVPTAKRTAATVNPYFLKMSLTLSLGDALSSSSSLSFSTASICSLLSVILSRALSLSEGCSFSSFAILLSSWMDFCSSEISLSFCAINTSPSGPKASFISFVRFWFHLFPVYFFKGKQRISFLAKTKLLHLQLSCFAMRCLEFRGLCLGKNSQSFAAWKSVLQLFSTWQ